MLEKLRKAMKTADIDMLLIPSADPHGSEYPEEYFKARKHFSGFTGSAGTLLIWQGGAGLWTDGRYFLQAERQLEGSGIDLFKMREPGVPTVDEFIAENIKGGVLGADLRTISASEGMELEKGGAILKDCRSLKTAAGREGRSFQGSRRMCCLWSLRGYPHRISLGLSAPRWQGAMPMHAYLRILRI